MRPIRMHHWSRFVATPVDRLVSCVMFVITCEPRLVEVVLLEIYSANKSRHLLMLFNPLMSTVAV